jgi:hypothetical protein
MSGEPLKLLNLPYLEARKLDRAARRQEPEALAYFTDLVAESDRCWLCDTPCGSGEGTVAMLDDPGKPGQVLLARYCPACSSLDTQVRLNKVFKLFRKIYPKWHPGRPGWRN